MIEGHGLLLPFDRDTVDFRDGFECGRLWTLAQASDEPLTETVHCTNGEMLLRIGEALGRGVVWEELQDGWAEVWMSEPELEVGSGV